MKRKVEVVVKDQKIVDDPNGGLVSLLNENVYLICNYIYAGKLVGVNTDCVELEDAYIVYQTGEWTAKNWADAQKLPAGKFGVQKAAIEAWGKK